MGTTDRILTLEQYKTLVSSLPTPTLKQMQRFAEFISGAHSWYKHLPLLPPGRPLQFFVDPTAGMQRIVRSDGTVEAAPRSEPGFHYSWLPTNEYRDRFGYLAFSQSSGTSVSRLLHDGRQLIASDDTPSVLDVRTRTTVGLPKEVLKAGRAFVSGIVHTLGSSHYLWEIVLDVNPSLDWPKESGGMDTLTKIRDRCRELREDASRLKKLEPDDFVPGMDLNLLLVDLPLHHLLGPERERQRAGMMAAMKRVIDLAKTKR